jgi:signal transduction histidine kinase
MIVTFTAPHPRVEALTVGHQPRPGRRRVASFRVENPAVTETSTTLPTGAKPPPQARRLLRPLTLAVLLIVVAATLAASWATRNLVRDQESRLLQERTKEVALVLNEAVGTIQSELATLGSQLQLPGGLDRFPADAAPQVGGAGGGTAVALLQPSGTGFVVAAVAGTGLSTGQVLGGGVAATASTALHHPGVYTTPVYSRGGTRLLGLATGPPAAPQGMVLYRETRAAGRSPSSLQSGPYSELYLALYDSPRPRSDSLLLANTLQLPLPGPVASEPFKLGQSPWFLEVAARQPLVGSVAGRAAWFVLGGGLLGAVLMGLLAEMIGRRRDYALALVDERTAELRASLGELAAAQAQLVDRERLAAIGQLASAVGHELRNPLGVISNSLYLLRRSSDPDDEKVRRQLDTADREVSAATLIVSDLLEYARGRQPIIAGVVIDQLVEEVLSVSPAPDGIDVSWDGATDVPPVAADRDQLRQVLLNLVTNAYDAMPDGGALTVDAARDGPGRIRIRVADTGPGMAEDTRSRVFEPFFTTKARGVGLGLAVSARIVGAHAGTIAVDSTPGAGTTFVVDLPVFSGENGA